MTRLIATAALAASLLAPATAAAKGGVIFDRYPDVQNVGAPMKFTAMLMSGEGSEQKPMRPIEGARPLVTFRNERTGAVVRVRASRSDLNGLSYGTVALPSKGPWQTRVTVAGRPLMPDDSQPFRVGVGLTQTIAAARPPAPARSDGQDVPWLWILAGAALGSAVLVTLVRRRPRWGAG